MEIKLKAFLIILTLLFSNNILSKSHYSLEHAEKLKESGKIKWREYGPNAFTEAKKFNKPVFLLLTAPSWCYWCHVYSSEDYLYHPLIFPYINEKFIPIFVDADKRQDLTRQYLEGGWPSTTVMTPAGERLFGFSGPRPVAFMLENMKKAVDFVNIRSFKSSILYNYKEEKPVIPVKKKLDIFLYEYKNTILEFHDMEYGGFGNGQKFPQAKTLKFILNQYKKTGENRFLYLVERTLKNQYTKINEIKTNYNLFDPVDGAFHRYGTKRDWTPPHYEKMLDDNVKLLNAYDQYSKLRPNDKIAVEVVKKTSDYIIKYWYDSESGGFYGNTDVHGEDHYYGKKIRSAIKPRIEKTKYSNWNSEAIITYLEMWKRRGVETYKIMAVSSLDFYSREMITEDGAYHYILNNGEKKVRGSLLDNAYLLLVFISGYEIIGDNNYIKTAKLLADYSLEKLYDWNSGGFFERNSPDNEMYKPGENINLSKPLDANGIIILGLLKLYKNTGEIIYLNAALKSLGLLLEKAGSLDRGFYFAESAEYILKNKLLDEYNRNKKKAAGIEKIKQTDFWLTNLLKNNKNTGVDTAAFKLSSKGINKMNGPIFLLVIVTFLAGFISFISPCTLPILPAYVAYSFNSSEKNLMGMTISFFLGLSIIFTFLGMTATVVGSFLKSHISFFSQIAGFVLILFGIYILLGRGMPGLKFKQSRPVSYTGSFLFGAVLGVSWTPCVGPVLVAVLILASTAGSVLSGGLLLFFYSMGLALPLLLLSSILHRVNRDGRIWKFIRGREFRLKILNREIFLHSSSLISGVLFIILGYLVFSGKLFVLNQIISTSPFQNRLFGIEELILNLLK